MPFTQVGMVLVPMGGHVIPHPPQLLGSTTRLTSQPSANAALQSANPAGQPEVWHTPLTQVPGHTEPQAPQLLGLVKMSTSQPFSGLQSQLAKPGMQVLKLQPHVQVPPIVFGITQAWPTTGPAGGGGGDALTGAGGGGGGFFLAPTFLGEGGGFLGAALAPVRQGAGAGRA